MSDSLFVDNWKFKVIIFDFLFCGSLLNWLLLWHGCNIWGSSAEPWRAVAGHRSPACFGNFGRRIQGWWHVSPSQSIDRVVGTFRGSSRNSYKLTGLFCSFLNYWGTEALSVEVTRGLSNSLGNLLKTRLHHILVYLCGTSLFHRFRGFLNDYT